MTARFVDDRERLALLRDHIKVASEIMEAFKIVFVDGIPLDEERAIAMLDEGLNRLECAWQDSFASVESDEDALHIDSPYGKPITALGVERRPGEIVDDGIN